jgi:hypothetical protein
MPGPAQVLAAYRAISRTVTRHLASTPTSPLPVTTITDDRKITEAERIALELFILDQLHSGQPNRR